MNDADNARFTEWLGGVDCFAVNLFRLAEQDVSPRQPCPLLLWTCLDVREDELYLDALGCLDAPV